MAGIYFESEPGAIVAVQSGETGRTPPIYLEGFERLGLGRVLATGFRADVMALSQIQPALDNTIHVTAAGPGIGNLSFSGIVPARICTPGGMESDPANSGLDSILAYYNAYNVGRRGRPLAFSLGTLPAAQFATFLVGISLEQTLDAGGTVIGRYNLNLKLVPSG